jgi:hypothetical protein
MTFKHQYKVMIGVMVLLAHAFIANAQDDEKRNTGESLGKQFLNNRVPGMQYAPEKPKMQRRATVAEQQENHDESSGMQLKKGTIKGMRFEGGSGFTPNAARKTVRTQAAGGALPSDQKAEQKTTPAANTPVAPAQGGVKESLEHKSAPAIQGKTIEPGAVKKATTEKKD